MSDRTDGPKTIDALGKACPMPVILLARAMGEVAVGEELLVLADDPGAKVDIPVWCRMKQQTYAGMEARDTGWAFRVRRAS